MDRDRPDRPGEEPDDGLGWLVGDDEEPETTSDAAPDEGSDAGARVPDEGPDAEPGRDVAPAPEAGTGSDDEGAEVSAEGDEDEGAEAPGGPTAPVSPAPAATPPGGWSGAKVLFLGLPLLVLLLMGWNRAASSDRFCAACHETSAATLSAARSVHADVPCITCHSGGGLAGSVKYVPTLLREGLASVTPVSAHGVLPARDCRSCHTQLSGAAHENASEDCTTCHGDVSHPVLEVPGTQEVLVAGTNDHPEGFIQTHGQAAVDQPSVCADCHQQKFCEACHLRETFPHPDGWISQHGKVQEQQGAEACTLCHAPTFCAGCHGTEIPHQADWLSEHDTAMQGKSTTPCATCHPATDCTTCHSEHAVHREQDLYVIPSPQAIPSTPSTPLP